MSRAALHQVIVSSGSKWPGAQAQNAGVTERILLPEGIGAGRSGRSILRAIGVTSDLQHDWEFWFWATALAQVPTNPVVEKFLGFWSFSVVGGDGKQIGAAGRYYYYIDGLSIPIYDDDAHNGPQPGYADGTYLNITLIDRTAGGKTAGSWFQPFFALEPTYGD